MDTGQPSPDVASERSAAGEETAQLHAMPEGIIDAVTRRLRLCAKMPLRTLTWVAFNGLLVYGIYVLLS
jgi:hypothetical protein